MSAVSFLNPRVGEWGGGGGEGVRGKRERLLLTVVRFLSWRWFGGGGEETPEADFTNNTS